jgi:ubiquinone/menaquinone biosynthesis C-methylase UbiE
MSTADLKHAQYQSSKHLEARIALHRRFTPPGQDMWDFVWNHYQFATSDHVLEIGCGTGEFWVHPACRLPSEMRLLLTDRSSGMIERARHRLATLSTNMEFGLADASHLPAPDDTFSVVLAHFMLYHVPVKRQALVEFSRVLCAPGWAGIVLTGPTNMAKIFDTIKRVAPHVNLTKTDAATFHAESGDTVIRSVFSSVARYDYALTMKVDDPELVIDYAQSSPSVQALHLSTHFWTRYRDCISAEMQHLGTFNVTKSCTLFVCHK